MKVHMRDFAVEGDIPLDLRLTLYKNKGGTVCGYIRTKTTVNLNKVTCFYCKRKLGINTGVAHRTTTANE